VVVDRVKEQLVGLLDLEGARFEYGSLLGHPPRLEPDATVTVGRTRRDVELSGLPAEARLVAVTLPDQAGRAFGASRTARSVS